VYQSGTYLYALELCRDLDGRLVRAIDATGAGEERVWDISTDARTAPMLLPTNDFSVPDKLLDQRHGIEAVGSIVTRRLQNCASLVVKEPRNKVSALLARASCGEAVAVLNAGELALRRLHEVDLLARLKALEPVTAAELTLARVVIPRRRSAALAAVRRARNRAVGTLQDFDRAVGVRLAQPGTMVS
jgi:antitoxin (DNA-binding transcriptional repressor) of toxin-antitoxin stability system